MSIYYVNFISSWWGCWFARDGFLRFGSIFCWLIGEDFFFFLKCSESFHYSGALSFRISWVCFVSTVWVFFGAHLGDRFLFLIFRVFLCVVVVVWGGGLLSCIIINLWVCGKPFSWESMIFICFADLTFGHVVGVFIYFHLHLQSGEKLKLHCWNLNECDLSK